jgi:hypothetical protein
MPKNPECIEAVQKYLICTLRAHGESTIIFFVSSSLQVADFFDFQKSPANAGIAIIGRNQRFMPILLSRFKFE